MPIPVLAGLPWLAGILGTFFTSVVAYLAQRVGKRFAFTLAGIAILVGLAGAYLSAITAIITGLSYAMPQAISDGAGLVMPGNTVPCITAIITAHTLRYAYAWNTRIVQLKFVGF